jgi:transaldolase
MDRLEKLSAAGTSIWLDFIDRAMIRDGSLARRIRDDSLVGMTSNPTIFEKALAEGHAYDEQIADAPRDLTTWQLFELVETDDVRAACDEFADVYRRTGGKDGYVSIEVSPGVANDADATIEEARRLWSTVDRPNVMVKVPGTDPGAEAIRRLTGDGINVNVTLLFAVDAHRRVIEAYLAGLEERVAAGKPIDSITSVASFFVSRVDTEVDKRLDALIASTPAGERGTLEALKGRAAIANARLAYELFTSMFSGARWGPLLGRGGRVQRPLWASTSTKNPVYRDVIYVEQLIGPDTVNTMTPATIDAFRDHGEVARNVDGHGDEPERTVAALAAAGISLPEVTDKLLTDGVASFQKSFDSLIAGLERKARALGRELARTR